jgi:hypothetical protein
MAEEHEEYWICENEPNLRPEILEGPFGTHHAANVWLKEHYNFPSDYVILVGDFPGKSNDFHE